MRIRPATPADAPALTEVYADAVRTLGPRHYSDRQVAAWAASADNSATLALRDDCTTLVGQVADDTAGFVTLEPKKDAAARVAMLYVAARFGRRGYGTRLLDAILSAAADREFNTVSAEASVFSLPVFVRRGFVVRAIEQVERQGVKIVRHEMVLHCPLPSSTGTPGNCTRSSKQASIVLP